MDVKSDDCAWFRKEHEIEVREDMSFSAFSSEGEVGIMLIGSETDLDLKTEEAAFLFGDNQDDLWFMPRMGSFYRVFFSPDEEPVAEKLYNQHTGTFRSCSLVNDIRISVPVFRNALGMIPIKRTHDVEIGVEDIKPAAGHDQTSDMIGLMDAGCDEAIEKKVADHLASTQKYYKEIMEAVDREIACHGGRVVVRYRSRTNLLCSYDLVAIKNQFFLITYAEFTGEWLADEEAINGLSPLWFSESDHWGSPVFQAGRCRDYCNRKLSDANISSIVVLPDGCEVINFDDIQKYWCENCATSVVRTTPSRETFAQTLHHYFAAAPVSPEELPHYDDSLISSIVSSFSIEQEY